MPAGHGNEYWVGVVLEYGGGVDYEHPISRNETLRLVQTQKQSHHEENARPISLLLDGEAGTTDKGTA